MANPTAILLAGPTASGKSALALELAERVGGVVVNADSMQVYRDLAIVTARPTPEDEARVPHALYGHVDAAENYSAGRYVVDAAAAMADAVRARRAPIFVGGTGLYFKALLHGLAAVPPVPVEIRARVRERLATQGVASLHAELAARDPDGATRTMPGDSVRIARALEVLEATGRPLADWHRDGMKPAIQMDSALKIFLDVPRAELARRIDARFDAMLAAGARDEVAALAARALDPALPAMKAHGVPWLIRQLRGEISLAEAADGGKRDTRRYTKRQDTWFRNQLPAFEWLTPDAARARFRILSR